MKKPTKRKAPPSRELNKREVNARLDLLALERARRLETKIRKTARRLAADVRYCDELLEELGERLSARAEALNVPAQEPEPAAVN